MNVIIYLKDGTSETHEIRDFEIDGRSASVGLKKKIIRPPEKHKLREFIIRTNKIEKIEIFMGGKNGDKQG